VYVLINLGNRENHLVSVSGNGSTATFGYDGDGNRVRKTVTGGDDILYINKYYEKNLTTGNITTSYYLSSRLVATCENSTLRYVHQDHLSGTSLMTDDEGNEISGINYYPFGLTRTGDVPTDRKFTGQRLDDTGLYYYGARYYDPEIGRFISADTIVPDPMNPQSFNRYSYCLNNPLKYIDPSGNKEVSVEGKWTWVPGIGWTYSRPYTYEIPDPEPDPNPEPDLPIDDDTSSEINNNPLKTTGVAIIGLAADDATGVGIIDDLLIPFVVVGGATWWTIENWDVITDKIGGFVDSLKVVFSSSAKDMPSKEDGYEPPKNWNGEKVKNPNGSGSGYPDKNGDVWIPTTHKGTHGFHWDVQHPGGGYIPVYPN
jgi:RHS repeat-associated protein